MTNRPSSKLNFMSALEPIWLEASRTTSSVMGGSVRSEMEELVVFCAWMPISFIGGIGGKLLQFLHNAESIRGRN